MFEEMSDWKKKMEKKFGPLQRVMILETNLDDVRGEILGDLIPELMNLGALDVAIESVITKKNRPGHILKVICQKQEIVDLCDVIIQKTGTLGIRISHELRICLKRNISSKEIIINGTKYLCRVKEAIDNQGNIVRQKLEFDDLKTIANEQNTNIHLIEQEIYCQLKSKNI